MDVETILQKFELTHGPYMFKIELKSLFAATYARTPFFYHYV